MRIAICGLVKSSNLGEQFISKSLAYLIKSNTNPNDLEFVEVDIQATNDITHYYDNIVKSRLHNLYRYKIVGIPADVLHYKLKSVADFCKTRKGKNRVYRLRHFIWKHSLNLGKRFYSYYDMKFKEIDLIVVDGAGLLEYSYNAYQESLAMITEYADSHGIPVVFNAIGRAGEFNKDDFRCKVLMSAFRHSCVKYVSARDSRDSVQECVGNKFNVQLLADAAFCVEEAFNIHADCTDKLIGIGLIRGDASLSYSKGFTEEDWIALFFNIAHDLQKRGYKYEFFSNGAREDYILGKKVINRLKGSSSILVKRPTAPEDLLHTISRYQGIITCRMHSSIAAFSMGIPSVILSWNRKVDRYMRIVGYPERAIKQSDFNSSYIVDTIEKAMTEGIDEEKRNRMKSLAEQSVLDYKYLFERK